LFRNQGLSGVTTGLEREDGASEGKANSRATQVVDEKAYGVESQDESEAFYISWLLGSFSVIPFG
jgi:hypothetical protein